MTKASARARAKINNADAQGVPYRRFAQRPAMSSEMHPQKITAAFTDGVLLGQDEERKRMAHELHDDISQRLFLASPLIGPRPHECNVELTRFIPSVRPD